MSKISELSDGGVIQGGDTLIAVRSGGNVKVTYGGSTTANIDGGTIDGTTIGGTTPAAGNFTTGSFTGNVSFGDNDKAIFGAGSDLQIYHDGFSSYIEESGAGSLLIRGDNTYLTNTAGTKAYIDCIADGEIILRHNNGQKLATTSTGVDVTGTVTADGLTVANTGTPTITIQDQDGTNQRAFLKHGAGNTTITTQNGTSHGQFQVLSYNGTDTINRLNIASGGDVSFYEDTGTTAKLFWDASDEALRVGSTSAIFTNSVIAGVSALGPTIGGKQTTAAQSAGGFWNSDTGTVNLLNFYAGSGGTQVGSIKGSSTGVSLLGTGGEGLTVYGTAGNVGIGTDSPSSILELEDTTANGVGADLRVINDGSAVGSGQTASVTIGRNFDERNVKIKTVSSGDYGQKPELVITQNQNESGSSHTEVLRIDSSGNLLVGTTVTPNTLAGASATQGLAFNGSSGYLVAAASGQATAYFNRQTSDGDIAIFRKDGSTVGSIGTRSSGLVVGSGDTGLFYDGGGDRIFPESPSGGAARDAAIDLGTSAARFKDLYLSGGAYLGGVAGANLLDDYEEGTWTPAFTPTTGSFTTITTVSTGRYTKVGRLVTLFATIRTSGTLDVTGASGNLKITGLPFTCNSTIAGGGADLSHQGWNIGILNTRMYIEVGTNFIVMYDNAMNESSFPSANIVVSDMSTSGGSFANLISFTASYEV